MIPRNHRNQKAYIDLSCPVCGMLLSDPKAEGFVSINQTFCCQGCASGDGCTCHENKIRPTKAGEKRGHMGQRNPENSPRDNNFNEEIDTSGRSIGPNKQESRKGPPKIPSRGDMLADGTKAPRSQSDPRDSTREQARGRSEFVNRNSSNHKVDRVSVTGTKNERQR
ncbi:MAG: hypothetical protein H0X66_20315 [Verrucomicrobia bacterium]|nr:hypothetical protein [Verrucomicrobiota bacterium]